MEEELLDILKDLGKEALRTGIRVTGEVAYKYLSKKMDRKSNSNTKLYHVGTNFFMNTNTVLYYSFEDNVVYGYSLHDFGDRWVQTNISLSENPANYDGGYSHIQKLYRDAHGNLYVD